MTPLESSEVTLQVVASPMIVILTTPEVSFKLLENIYSTGITHEDRHLRLSIFYSTGRNVIKLFVCNLQIFVISYGVCPWQAFPA
jgi:hypothetical protein